jgi:hypothetical protein
MSSDVNHKERKHALLSPSGAERWINCTPSARFEEKFIDPDGEESSVYAMEGTLAHEFADVNLRHFAGEIADSTKNNYLSKLRKHELYDEHEMEDEVAKFVDYVTLQYAEAERLNGSAELLVERKVDLSEFIEGGFGTSDATIISDGIMDVIDLKYGRGVQVEAEENSQLMIYGLGSLYEFMLLYDIHTVRLNIVQPRLNHISVWSISAEELLDWGYTLVKPKAEKAHKGEGELVAGDHCKWCAAKNRCPALAAKQLEMAKYEFEEPTELTDEQLLKIYDQIPQLVEWANSIEKYMLEEALKGKEWDGLKLVEGRSYRRWADESKAALKLEEEGYKPEEIYNTKIKGITDIEKLVSKTNFDEIVGEFVNKPPGKPSLVPESDKREPYAISSAKEDFED